MNVNWKTIEKDGLPPVGTFCLCKLVHEFNSWSDYTVLKVCSVVGRKMFMKYDLVYPDKNIVKYIPIDNIDKED